MSAEIRCVLCTKPENKKLTSANITFSYLDVSGAVCTRTQKQVDLCLTCWRKLKENLFNFGLVI